MPRPGNVGLKSLSQRCRVGIKLFVHIARVRDVAAGSVLEPLSKFPADARPAEARA
jgi:hypothetical protein